MFSNGRERASEMVMSNKLRVSEMFKTIQGEATFTGTPSIFVRMQFCDIGCPWCDTKYTWSADEKDRSDRLLNQQGKWTGFSTVDLAARILQMIELEEMKNPHIVFTGGEPCYYDLRPITSLMNRQGFTTQIETSGTYQVECDSETWVTVSPKIGMPGGRSVLESALQRANEIKMPIGKQSDVDNLLSLLKNVNLEGKSIWLQPLSRSPKATDLCIETSMLHGFKVSIQTHHFIGLP